MKKTTSFFPAAKSILFAFLCLAVFYTAGCDCTTSDRDLQAAYQRAVKDASVAEPGEISRNLEAIVPYNPDITWEGQPGESRVLLLTWTSWDGYNTGVGKSITGSREVWTVVPHDLSDFMRAHASLKNSRMTLRLEQLFGIPPHNGKKYFVKMWVNKIDIFRPSADPDIADSEAELDFPGWVDTSYRQWFNNLKSTSYGENGYPWTRLGYTYDWNNPKNEVGLSEFIIKSGASVTVQSVENSP
jgi:hypothetical protein